MLRLKLPPSVLRPFSLRFVSSQQKHMSTMSAQSRKKAVIFDMGGVFIPSALPTIQKFAVKNNLNPEMMNELLFKGGDTSE